MKRRRIRTAHPGVKLLRRTWRTRSKGKQYRGVRWIARWKDPLTGSMEEVTFNKLSITTAEGRRVWAIEKSETLAKLRANLKAGKGPGDKPWLIPDAIKDYLERATERLVQVTVEGYEASLKRFLEWAERDGTRHLNELTPPHLAMFKDWIQRVRYRKVVRKGKRGERRDSSTRRSASSVNHDLLRTRIFLHDARRLGRTPLLDRDAVTDTLSGVRGDRARPPFLRSNQIRELLQACQRHDRECFTLTREEKSSGISGTVPRYHPATPLTLFILLTGCRSRETRELRWEYLYLDGEAPEIILPASATKTRFERSIDLKVCPSLVRILEALRLQSEGKPYVFGGDEPLFEGYLKSLNSRLVRKFGAPAFSWQKLRQTCATYLTNAPGIYGGASAYLSARRCGHSVTVAEQHYTGLLRDIPKEASTLEQAMGIEEIDSAALQTAERREVRNHA